MKRTGTVILLLMFTAVLFSCRSTKKIQSAINKKDTSSVVLVNTAAADSLKLVQDAVNQVQNNYINFKTFNSKIKVEYVDSKGKQSSVTAYVNMIKDSVVWVSLYATIFNIEAFRVLIKKDSVILVDKLNKEVQYRSLSYLQEVTEIPFDFKTIQELLVGNPIYFNANNIVSYRQTDDRKRLLTSVGQFFKTLLTTDEKGIVLKSKLDDVDINRNRTADIIYAEYETTPTGINFAKYREINVSEKNKLEIRLNYKQYEFNKALTISFNVPKNYKKR